MALQHLRSSTANKRPTPTSMADGQVALNTAAVSPGVFFKDAGGSLVKVGPVHVGTTAPNVSPAGGGHAGNSVGEQWLDTTGGTYVFKVWDGSAWRSETGTFVDVNGDVMTGALGIIAGTAAAPGLYISGDTNTGIYSPGADQVAVATNGVGRLFIDASGNVGVGTTSSVPFGVTAVGFPLATFKNTSASTANSINFLNNADVGLGFITYGSTYAGGSVLSVGASGSALTATNDLAVNVGSTLRLGTAGTERARITSAGLVGIGTSSPQQTLSVTGGVQRNAVTLGTSASPSEETGYIYKFEGASGTQAGLYFINTHNSNNATWLSFKTTTIANVTNTALTIDSSQRVGIGTTAPTQLVTIRGANFVGSSFNGQAIEDPNAERIRVGYKDGSLDTGLVPAQIVQVNAAELAIASRDVSTSAIRFHTGTGVPERARIDSSGRVGIGTSSPAMILDARTNVTGLPATTGTTQTNGVVRIASTATTGCIDIGSNSGAPWIQSTDRTDLSQKYSLLINPNGGQVGIGTSSPDRLLHLSGADTAYLRLENQDTTGSVDQYVGLIEFEGQDSGGAGVRAQIGAIYEGVSGATAVTIGTSADAGSVTERVRINRNGNVGIGTTSPGAALHVEGSELRIKNGTGVPNVTLAGRDSDGTAILAFQNNGSSANNAALTATTNTLAVATGGTERARIDSSGRVGIGTTSPGFILHTAENASTYIRIQRTTSGTEGDLYLGCTSSFNQIISSGTSSSVAKALTFTVGSTEAARIDSSGRLLVGTSTSTSVAGAAALVQIETGANLGLSLLRRGDVPIIALAATGGSGATVVTSGQNLGEIRFAGADGTDVNTLGASIIAVVDGTPGADDLPTRLVFSTTADGAASPTERMRITSTGQVSIASGAAVIDTATTNAPYLALVSNPLNATGAELRMGARTSSSSTSAGIKAIHPDGSDPDYVSIGIYVRNSGTSTDPALEIARADYQGSFRPGADNARPLGNASFRWSEVFAGTGTINTSDETLKENIQDLEQAELSVAAEIKSLIKRFRFKDAVASKGDDARIHVGVIAQEVEQAFVNNGLDPRRYALFCEDTLEDGSKRLGIRYDELLAFVIAAL